MTSAFLVVSALLTVFGCDAGQQSAESFRIHGLALGWTLPQLRRHFDASAWGAWSKVTGCNEPAVAWSPTTPSLGSVRYARFEFHQGMLVALRLRVDATDPAAAGPSLETYPRTVIARATQPDGDVALVWLRRDCASHTAELRELLARGAVRF